MKIFDIVLYLFLLISRIVVLNIYIYIYICIYSLTYVNIAQEFTNLGPNSFFQSVFDKTY